MLTKCSLIGLLLLLLMIPAAAQDGQGVIIAPNPAGSLNAVSFNPLLCQDQSCNSAAGFLFPSLFAHDPATQAVIAAAPGSYGLVIEPSLDTEAGNLQTLHLRDDLTWSDGTPVTAYDVFYGYLAVINGGSLLPFEQERWLRRNILGGRVMDAHSIVFEYAEADCSSFPRTNFPVVPSHILNPEFAAFVDEMNAAREGVKPYQDWLDGYRVSGFAFSDFPHNQPITAGRFIFDGVRLAEGVRLIGGNSAFVLADVPNGISPTDFFLAGKANVMLNPPTERRDDVRATPDLQIAEMPGPQWDAIIFNTADSRKPRNAFNDKGEPLDQGHHPLFGDVRVRRAIQMAINIDELGEVTYQGNITPIGANLPPTSWAYNPDLRPVVYDPMAAAHLLDEAGWRDANRDGVRECHGCLYAPENWPLSFTLSADPLPDLYSDVGLILQQLRQIGFSVQDVGGGSGDGQFFDAHLTTFTFNDPDPDQSVLFTRAGDRLNGGANVGSYYNEQVESLMQQARTVPGCDQEKRAELYRQIQAILHEDQPYAWLYARDVMYVAQAGVRGFAPYAGNPYWNIRDWVVMP